MLRTFSYLSVLVSLVLLTSVSCKDKDDKKPYCTENPNGCQSVLAAKDFFLFKEGSWWVYQEETSLERDSVYVYEYNNTSGYDFDMRVRSSLTGYEYHYFPVFAGGNQSCSESAPVQGKCLYIKESKGKPNDYIGESYCFFVNYKVNDDMPVYNTVYPNNRIVVTNINSTFSIQSLTFSETVKIHELNNFNEGRQPSNHYFSRGVGLVCKELIDSNEVWNLVSYHIES